MAQEAVRRDLELQHVPASVPRSVLDRAREHLVLGLRRREGPEVVLAEQQVGRFRQPLLGEWTRVPPAPLHFEGRRLGSPEDAVAVAPGARRVARVEVGLSRLACDDRHVVGKDGVERLGDAAGGRAALDVDARHLTERMDARVCSPGDGQTCPRGIELVERGTQLAVDGAKPGLRGPAAELGAVVLEGELEARYGAAVASAGSSATVRTSGAGGT
jgi:hypothetical protein